MRRTLLSALLLLGMIPFSAEAATLSQRTAMRKQARLAGMQTSSVPYRNSRSISRFEARKQIRMQTQQAHSSRVQTTLVTMEAHILELVNAERTQRGLTVLKSNDLLRQAAQAHAKDMFVRDFFSHENPDGETVKDRIDKTGYLDFNFATCGCQHMSYAIGENIAKGQETADEVMTAWMNSPDHKANILSAGYTEIGIAHYGDVWVQDFGRLSTW